MRSFISISLAFFSLFSTIGMAKTTHFCMGMEMKSAIGFGEKHVDCGMNMPMDHEENQDDNHQDPKSCCENVTTHLQVDDEVFLKKAEILFNLNFAVALVQVFVFGLDPVSSETTPLPTYYPPPNEQDLQVLHQTFLI